MKRLLPAFGYQVMIGLLLVTAGCGGSATPIASLPSPSPTPSPVVLSGHGDHDKLAFYLQDGQYQIEFTTDGPDPVNEVLAFGFYGTDGQLIEKSLCVVTRPCSFSDLPHLTSGTYYLVIRATDVTWKVTFHRT